MGCGFSAGGSQLVVAVAEYVRYTIVPIAIVAERRLSEVGFRWCDDILFAAVLTRRPGTNKAMMEELKEDFHGEKLKMIKVKSNIAFGFRFVISM